MRPPDRRRRWLIVPVETKARELEAKALFAFHATQRGWSVILGRFDACDRDRLPRGLFVLKGIPPGSLRSLQILRRLGHTIVSWCEEGLIYASANEYGFRKIESRAFPLLELFFAWGPRHAHDLTECLGFDAQRLLVTGNPRFDLLRPEFRSAFSSRAALLEKDYGRFILVNTKLNRYNHYFGTDWYVNRIRALGRERGGSNESEAVRCVEFQRRTFVAFMEAIIALSRRFPATRIVLRPHPSENHEPWIRLAKDLPNVHVVFKANAIEWLLAASVTIQNNCTTGVESYLLGRPSIAYRPLVDQDFDMILPNAVSTSAFTLDSLLELTRGALRGVPPPGGSTSSSRETVRQYLSGVDGHSACEAILGSIDDFDVPRSPPPALLSVPRKDSVSFPHAGPERFYGSAGPERYCSYRRQKLEGIAAEEVSEFLEAIREATGRFDRVRVNEFGKDLLCIGAE